MSVPDPRHEGEETIATRGGAPSTSTEKSARRGYAMIAIAASLWGTWSLFLRPAERISALDPALETFLLFATMTVAISPLALRDWKKKRVRSRRAWILLIAVGVTDAANVGFFFWAMQRGSLAVAVLSHYLAPLFVALSAPMVLGERGRFPARALILALVGLSLLVWPGPTVQGDIVASAALGASSAVFYALTTLLNKTLEPDFSARELLVYHSGAATLLLVPFLLTSDGGSPLALAYVIAGAALLSAVGSLVYLNGLRRVPASRAAVLTLLEPVVALFVGAIAWGETLTLRGAFGAILVLAGAYVVLTPAVREVHDVLDGA